ncbi:SWEET sugar transporter [Corchorus olitorius]|uniref:SWEET sugar transporter n=1 Tax=Corchorus olitorius TaxID=93759 RepID=A0A1R3K8A7_9ROSI|nr:SWEET sugar transporter [Corchorus olitorius]
MAPALSFIIGIIGNVISIMFFASPMKTFREVVKKKSTGEYEVVPYITTLLCTNIWMFYGFRKPGGLLIITVNAAGAILQFIYITLFLIYSPLHKKVKTVKLAIIFNIGFLGSAIAVPSVTGVVLGSAQMILYSIYRNKSKVENQVKIGQNDHGAKNMIEVSVYKETSDEQEQKPVNIACNRPGSIV